MNRFLGLTMWLLCCASAAPAEVAGFPFQYRAGFLWVEVAVPQSEKPLSFLVDTGAGVSAINLSTAIRIGLRLGGPVIVHGVRTCVTGYLQQHVSARIGDVLLPEQYLAVDLGRLSSACQRPVDGLLGADFFRHRVVEIDFQAQRIRILKAAQNKEFDSSLPLQIRACGMRVPVRVNGHKDQWVRLDTGCATALQWVTSKVPDQCNRQVAIGLAAVSIPQAKTTVMIADHKFDDVSTGLHRRAIFPGEAGLLGLGLLARFSTVTIDAQTDRVIFGPLRRGTH